MDTATDTFLSARQVQARYGDRSRMWVERRLKCDPDFPRPLYIGRLRFWRLADLEAWERACAAKQGAA